MIAAVVMKKTSELTRFTMLLPDHTVLDNPSDDMLRHFLQDFRQIGLPVSRKREGVDYAEDGWKEEFKNGKDGTWTNDDPALHNPKICEIMAYITDDHSLVLLNFHPFQRLMTKESRMVSVDEFAYRHGRSREIVKRYCRNTTEDCGGFQLQGARKLKRIDEKGNLVDGRVWIVPEDAPMPGDLSVGSVKYRYR